MKGIILAAGRGSRLLNFTNDRPKCMVEVNNKPMLFWQIEAMSNLKLIDEIAIVTGYLGDQLASINLKRFHNSNWKTTNMVKTLMEADEWLSRYECIVSYSDIIYEHHILKKLTSSKNSIALTYDINWQSLWSRRFQDPLSDAESFKLKSNDKYIKEIGASPKSISEIKGQYMGLIKFLPSGWTLFTDAFSRLTTEQQNCISMTQMFQKLLEMRVEIEGVPIDDIWTEVDDVSDLKVAQEIFEVKG